MSATQHDTKLIAKIADNPVGFNLVEGFDIVRFREKLDAVNQDIDQFSKFANDYKDKNWAQKLLEFGVTEKIITATDAVAQLGRLTLELQAVTSVIAAKTHSISIELNKQAEVVNSQQEALDKQGQVVLGIPDQLRKYHARVVDIRTKLMSDVHNALTELKGATIKQLEYVQQELQDIQKTSEKHLNEAINSVNGRIVQSEKNVAILREEANSLKVKVDACEKDLANIDTVIKKLDEKVDAQSSTFTKGMNNLADEIKLVKRQREEGEKSIAVVLTKKADVKEVESITQDTKNLKSEVDAHAEDLTGVKDKVKELDELITNLSNRTSRSELASNIRMAKLQRNFYLSSGFAICAVIVAVLALSIHA